MVRGPKRASLRTVDGTVKADEGTDSLAEASLSTDEGGDCGGGQKADRFSSIRLDLVAAEQRASRRGRRLTGGLQGGRAPRVQ